MTVPIPSRVRERGAALFTALIFLVVISLIALSSLGTSLLELRMSSNEEFSMNAFQRSQAAIDNVIANSGANFIIAGSVGHTNCTADLTCDSNGVTLPAPFDTVNELTITRTSDSGCPPRSSKFETSCTYSQAASFDIASTFDKASMGQGRAKLNQGYIKLYPTTPGGGGGGPATAEYN